VDGQNHPRRIKWLEDFLFSRVRVSAPDPLVAAAVARLEWGPGAKRIDALTPYIGLSQSALERRFRRVVGISPKKFASLVRLRRAVRLRARLNLPSRLPLSRRESLFKWQQRMR
jgi:transcriptional regulator GlxA family with amidase domain